MHTYTHTLAAENNFLIYLSTKLTIHYQYQQGKSTCQNELAWHKTSLVQLSLNNAWMIRCKEIRVSY